MTGSDMGSTGDYFKVVRRCHGCLPARGVHSLTLLPFNSLRYRYVWIFEALLQECVPAWQPTRSTRRTWAGVSWSSIA